MKLGFIYGLNIFDSYWSNVYLYRYTIACTSLSLGIFAYDLLCDGIAVTRRQKIKRYYQLDAKHYIVLFMMDKASEQELIDGKKIGCKATDMPMRHITESEFKAMAWIRDNLSDEAVIASDRKKKVGWSYDYVMNVWFGYSAYSGRQFYNEGSDYNPHAVNKVSQDRWNNIEKLLRSKDENEVKQNFRVIDADYLIVTKRLGTASDALKNFPNTVFENDGIKLIKNPNR